MYHSGNSELEQLEDRHYRFNQKLSELEWDYADMRMDVRQHTENLVDWLSAIHFQAPSAEAQSGLERLFALQEEFEAELKRYEERLEEEREREQQNDAGKQDMAHITHAPSGRSRACRPARRTEDTRPSRGRRSPAEHRPPTPGFSRASGGFRPESARRK